MERDNLLETLNGKASELEQRISGNVTALLEGVTV